jgi:hypothetical protein
MQKSQRRGEVMDIWEPSESFTIGMVLAEGPIRRPERGGGSEWEPIKILLEGD